MASPRSAVGSRTSTVGLGPCETPVSRLRTRAAPWEDSSVMNPSLVATSLVRRRPVSHAFTVPVVREVAPQPVAVGAGW